MNRAKSVAILALLLALVAGPAASQGEPAAPLTDPDDVLVEELVVTARYPGPAWWRVSDADSVVYVLGAPDLAPKRQQWDRIQFERRLKGANAVILPFRSLKVKLLGVPGALSAYLKLKSSTDFETTLPQPLRDRFVAARERLGEPAKHYDTKNPLAAGVLMAGDFREKNELVDTDPMKLIRHLAQQAGVPIVQKTYDLSPLLRLMARTPRAAGTACLEGVLEQVEAGPGATLAAARAWAEGDVRGALGADRSYERCLNAAPGALDFDARAKADQAAAIARALETPGHAIALVHLRPLLSQGGVLDRLRAQGFEVKTPGEE